MFDNILFSHSFWFILTVASALERYFKPIDNLLAPLSVTLKIRRRRREEENLGSDAQGSGLNLTGALRPVRFDDGYHYLVHHYREYYREDKQIEAALGPDFDETAYLSKSPANVEALERGIRQYETGQHVKIEDEIKLSWTRGGSR